MSLCWLKGMPFGLLMMSSVRKRRLKCLNFSKEGLSRSGPQKRNTHSSGPEPLALLNRPRRDKSSRTGGGTERSLRLTRAIGLAHRPLPVRWSSTPWHPRRLWSTESENGGRTEPVYRVEPRLGHRKGERGARTGASDPVLPTILSHGELHICWLDIAV